MRGLRSDGTLLFLPPSGIGDNLMMLPLAYEIKDNFPSIKIHFLSNQANGASTVMGYSRYVDRVIRYDMPSFDLLCYLNFFTVQYLPLIKRLKNNNYDSIFAVYPNIFRKAILKFFPSSRWVVGRSYEKNQILTCLEMLKTFGLKPHFRYKKLISFKDNNRFLDRFNLTPQKYIVINPYSKTASRTFYQAKKLTAQLKKILSQEIIIVLAGKTDSHQSFGGCIDLVNKTSLTEVGQLIENSLLVITVDGGLFHMSTALRKPTIGLFGVSHSSLYIPQDPTYPYLKTFDSNEKRPLDKVYFKKVEDKRFLDRIPCGQIVDEVENFIRQGLYEAGGQVYKKTFACDDG